MRIRKLGAVSKVVWLRISHEVLVKLLVGLQLAEGWTGARGSAFKITSVFVGKRLHFLVMWVSP